MFNKILVFGGGALSLIFIFSNMVAGSVQGALLWTYTPLWFLLFINTFVGIIIGYGIKGMFEKGNEYEENDFDF